MTRFPLRITNQELPPKRLSRSNQVGAALILFAVVLILIYIVFPAFDVVMNP